MSRLPSLSEYDRSADVSPQARSERRGLDGGAMAARMPVIAGPGCWCGEPQGHDWPGKADGAPHPRAGRSGGAL